MEPVKTTDSSNGHLQIFNPTPQPTETFPLFPRLPAEIRYLIWEQALSHERLLRIKLERIATREEKSIKNSEKTQHGLPEPGRGYQILLKERHAISKLFRVTSESRRAALSFYRVHLPCRYEWFENAESNGTLYLCPELYILEIKTDGNRHKSPKPFANFAHDVWAHDPRRIGLVNLSIPAKSHKRELHLSEKTQSSLLRQVIRRLELVIFSQRRYVWQMCYPVTFAHPGSRGFKMNRSVPITSSVTRFDRLPTDPRTVKEELEKMHIGHYLPHRAVSAWFKLLRSLDLEEDQLNIDYRFLLSHESRSSPRICSRNDAEKWVQDEDKEWKGILKWKRERYKELAREETPEELAVALRPAIGFWLFPLESIGALPGIDKCQLSEPHGFYRSFFDMSKYSPELCLSQLP
ncbi:2EXR domain-containing protein [Fusarium sp. LHS14.1]|nr:2EXR domain-containing protein [Fusarium sp. LHS14.1]